MQQHYQQYVLVEIYSLDQYVVDHLIYLFVTGLFSLALLGMFPLAGSIQLQRQQLNHPWQKIHRAKVEGLTSNKRPILELKDVSFRCLCFKLLNGMAGNSAKAQRYLFFIIISEYLLTSTYLCLCTYISYIFFNQWENREGKRISSYMWSSSK